MLKIRLKILDNACGYSDTGIGRLTQVKDSTRSNSKSAEYLLHVSQCKQTDLNIEGRQARKKKEVKSSFFHHYAWEQETTYRYHMAQANCQLQLRRIMSLTWSSDLPTRFLQTKMLNTAYR